MILSRSLGFIFIKGRKVGGTSVEMALSTLCGPSDVVTPLTPIDERARLALGGEPRNYSGNQAAELEYIHQVRSFPSERLHALANRTRFYNHMPLTEVLRHAPDVSHLPVVCVERNPYAKVLSLANWMCGFEAYSQGSSLRFDLQQIRVAASTSVRDKTMLRVRNLELYESSNGEGPNKVIRYEELQREFALFVSSLGIQAPELPHAKKGALSNALDPLSFFDRVELDEINCAFEKEFDLFGYRML